VDVYIGYLRKKIDKAFVDENSLITTIKGVGYKLNE
jgi:DNA-binding response OmpR family regulator